VAQALLIVDIQNDYFPGGANPLDDPEAAADQARMLLQSFRMRGLEVVHMQHVWDAPEATFMVPGSEGVEINERVAPIEGEEVFAKAFPNSFVGTPLEEHLRSKDIDELLVCGMMTSMCVDATVRAGVDLGFVASVAQDACATMPLEFNGRAVAAPDVQTAFLAALADGYATVAPADELIRR
jgi:nicotinamidase-related amidase